VEIMQSQKGNQRNSHECQTDLLYGPWARAKAEPAETPSGKRETKRTEKEKRDGMGTKTRLAKRLNLNDTNETEFIELTDSFFRFANNRVGGWVSEYLTTTRLARERERNECVSKTEINEERKRALAAEKTNA